jgi:hypothetical protein
MILQVLKMKIYPVSIFRRGSSVENHAINIGANKRPLFILYVYTVQCYGLTLRRVGGGGGGV